MPELHVASPKREPRPSDLKLKRRGQEPSVRVCFFCYEGSA